VKTLLLTFTLSLLCYLALSQHTYIPLPDSNIVWVTEVVDHNESGGPGSPTEYSLDIRGWDGYLNIYFTDVGQWLNNRIIDTSIIPNRHYHYMSSPNYDSTLNASNGGFKPISFGGTKLRIDSSKKIHYYLSSPGFETKLWDLNWVVGDTISNDTAWINQWSFNFYNKNCWINKKDSLFLPTGKWHYRYWLQSDLPCFINNKHFFIEGVGADSGFGEVSFQSDHWFHECNAFKAKEYHCRCIYINDTLVYSTPNHWALTCDSLIKAYTYNYGSLVGVDDLVNQIPFKIYPNPFASHFTINIEAFQMEEYGLTIYNLKGQEILKQAISSSVELVDLDHLSNGVYLVEVQNEKGHTSTQKIIKN